MASDGSWLVPTSAGGEGKSAKLISSLFINLNAAVALVLLAVPPLTLFISSSPLADLIPRLARHTGFASHVQLKPGESAAALAFSLALLCWFAVGRVRPSAVLASKRRLAGQFILFVVTLIFLLVAVPALASSNSNNSYAGGWTAILAWLVACLPWLIGLSLHYFGAANPEIAADPRGYGADYRNVERLVSARFQSV